MIVQRTCDGSVRLATEWGGYTLAYAHKGTALCPHCAAEVEADALRDGDVFEAEPFPVYEGSDDLYCDRCSDLIEL